MSLYEINTSPKFFKYYGSHTHKYYELILNLEGNGIMTIGSEEYNFFPGSVHIVPKNTPHIKYTEDKFRDIYLLTDTLPYSIQSDNPPVAFLDDANKTLETLMYMMLYRYLAGNKNDIVLESMYELAMSIVAEAASRSHRDPLVEQLLHRLTHSFNDPELSVSSVLDSMGYSKDHLRRIFISNVGVSPSEYLTSVRINHAKKLLINQKETHLPVSEISALCGYYDSRYFSRIFKKTTGLTPLEYARNH